MITCRITPRGPVIAMAYTIKVANQEHFVEANKPLAESSELLVEKKEGENSRNKGAFVQFAGEFYIKTNVSDSETGCQRNHSKTMDDYLLPIKSQSSNNNSEDEHPQTAQPRSLEINNDTEDPLPRTVTNEIKKGNLLLFPYP